MSDRAMIGLAVAGVLLAFACPIFHYFGKRGFPWCEQVTSTISY